MVTKVKWFSDESSCGSIRYEGKSVFIQCSTEDGESVELELVKTEKGYEVKNKDRN